MVVFQGLDSGNHKVADQKIATDSYQNYLRKIDIFFPGKQQGAIRTDPKIYCLLLYHFSMVVTIFKVGNHFRYFQQLDVL